MVVDASELLESGDVGLALFVHAPLSLQLLDVVDAAEHLLLVQKLKGFNTLVLAVLQEDSQV